MSVLILLLIASLSIAVLFLGAFLWSVKNRQFDDNFSPPRRILFEEPPFSTGPDEPYQNPDLSTKPSDPQ